MVSLTKGQRPSFKQYLGGLERFPFTEIATIIDEMCTINDKFLDNQSKCFRLYRYFSEVNDYALCNIIEHAKAFNCKIIQLGGKDSPGFWLTSPNDIESLAVFLASSISFHKKWDELNIYSRYIQDIGFRILNHGLRSSNVIIDSLHLKSNVLTAQSSSLISKFTVRHKVKILEIANNDTIGEDQQLYSMLTDPCNVLEELNMSVTKLSSTGAIALFKGLEDNNKLKRLYLDRNNITDDASGAIVTALESNKCLTTLLMSNNPLSSKAIKHIVQCLVVNNTLEYAGFPKCPKNIQSDIMSLQGIVNKKRESQRCEVKLKVTCTDFY